MNPVPPSDPRQDMEARIVALLLGEASPFEEAQLLQAIRRDPELAAFYRDMQKTVGLLREVAQPHAQGIKESTAPAPAPKLSPARRAALLAALETSPGAATPPAAQGSVASVPPKPVPASLGRRVWRRIQQPIGPDMRWVWKLAAAVVALAMLASLLMPALSPAKAKAARIAELNRQKVTELERSLAEAEARHAGESPAPTTAFAGQGPAGNSFGVATGQPATPAKQNTANARFANEVYLPTASLGDQAVADFSDRPVNVDGDLGGGRAESRERQDTLYFYFDAQGASREAGGGGAGGFYGRAEGGRAQAPQEQRLSTRDAKDIASLEVRTGLAAAPANRPIAPPAATPAPAPAAQPASSVTALGVPAGTVINGRADGLAEAGATVRSLDNLQRSYALPAGGTAVLPQQDLALQNIDPVKSRSEAAESFWRDQFNVSTVNAAEPANRLEDAQNLTGGQLQVNGLLKEASAGETRRKRLAEQDGTRELERLARRADEAAQTPVAKSLAGGLAGPPPQRTPMEAADKREEKAAEGKKELLQESLEVAKMPTAGDTPQLGRIFAPPPSPAVPPGKPDAEETLAKGKPGASLPPLIHQLEVQTAPNSGVNFSTFSLNVSDVSFKTAAASLQAGQWPDPHSIRVEEFINAFHYRDPAPAPGARLAFNWEMARHPFAHQRDLLRFSIQTAALGRQAAQPLHLVVLLDNSGSMGRPDRVAIVGQALRVLADKLQPQDKLSVVAFARRPQLCVDGQPGHQAREALQRVLQLNPEGGTDLGAGLDLAYQTALKHFHARANNRVLLLTDGAANLGDVDPEVLKRKVVSHRQKGVALDCFGVGWEGLDDDLLELLSRNGDGRYALLNEVDQAATEFAEKLAGALNVAAADVKTQVEFNPYRVTAYRQIGYARHQLTKEQFRDNTVDAAELAAAEAGNAMYVVQVNPQGSGPLGVVRVRYRVPQTGEYEEREWVLPYQPQPPSLEQASPAMRLAAAAALFGEYLSRNPYAGEIQLKRLAALAGSTVKAFEPDPRPQQLLTMLQQALRLEGMQ
ncbi:MAG: von Willebrand factor type A domain-containing protein [Verrucomicrobiae bacterium]|nr:von Willebrand factor type A domain-containing protein [Verrucomicrobiae bacterium]